MINMDTYITLGSLLYGLVNITNKKSYRFLTHWVWIFHCLVNIYRIFGKNLQLKKILLIMSFVGSICVLLSYVFAFMFNSNLEKNLNDKSKSRSRIILRSIILHVLPCVISTYILSKYDISDMKPYVYFYYLLIPLAHLFMDIISKDNTFNAYEIYINNDKHKNNKDISQLNFLLIVFIINLLTIIYIINIKFK